MKNEYTYMMQHTSLGTRILVFNGGIFERMFLVETREYRPVGESKFLQDVDLDGAHVQVFDKAFKLLYEGTDAVEWIIENPLHPDHVRVEGVGVAFSIDDFLREYDDQEEDEE